MSKRSMQTGARREDLVVHNMGDDIVLYNASGEQIHVLNHTSAFIWSYCDGNTTLEQLIEKMSLEYRAVDEPTLRHDIISTLESFRSLGLLKG